MKFDSLHRRLDVLHPGPVEYSTCPLWPDARLVFVMAFDDNRDAARAVIDALRSDWQNRSCQETIASALDALSPFPAVRAQVADALEGICSCQVDLHLLPNQEEEITTGT